ncbi:MAG: hypothetical protein JWN55_1989 [Frankiales bacterium]|nr:hypothetical protein [Frankiales bacterium]
MVVSALSRRALATVLAAGLAAGGLVVAGAAAAAGTCPTYKDAAGDSAYVAPLGTPDPLPLFNADEDLDILDVSHSVDAGVFTSTVHVAALGSSGPFFSASDRFATSFTVAGKAVKVTVDRDYTDPTSDPVEVAVLSVGGTASTAKVSLKLDEKASTVTTGIAVEDLEKAVGAPLAGLPFSAMSAVASLTTPDAFPTGVSRPVDTATAPATAGYLFGTSCSGDAPTPVPTDTPTPTPTPTGPPGLFEQPRKDCVQYKDPAGDADPTPTGLDNEPALDVTSVNLKSPAEGLQVYVKVADLGAGLFPLFDTARYDVTLTVGGKKLAVTVDEAGKATATVGGTASADLKPTAKLDTKSSVVVVTLPTEGLTKVLGAPLARGAAVTDTAVATAAGESFTGEYFAADAAAGAKPAEKTYAYGDNTCFLPPAGKLFLDGATSGVYSDTAKVTVSLLDVGDAAVADVPVRLTLTGAPALTATTNDKGDAVFSLPVTVAAGARTLTAAFEGTTDVGAATVSQAFPVKLETAVLKAAGSRGAVTATLTDNDRTVLKNQVVAFTVAGKVTKVKTNAKGQAVLKGLKTGTAVKVGFAAVKGYYAAAPTVTAKAQ